LEETDMVGGDTLLPTQVACLQAIGCQGGGTVPGENARQLAMVIASVIMAGELSLLAALAANTLVANRVLRGKATTAVAPT
jgi:hydroxymethylglutaryl-CoA reductase (NADPH)